MRKLRINIGKGYDVLIERGLLSHCGKYVRSVSRGTRAMVVCGETVSGLYSDTVRQSLENAGFLTECFVYPGGEKHKNADTYIALLNAMADFHMCRSDCVVALGGGVTGDIAGFAAASYMRGVSFVQIPTTLLSMVDSSVGGKCGIDLSAGKNLVGAFYQPLTVLCDPDVLSTLSPDDLCDGYAEVAKYSMLCKPNLLSVPDCETVEIVYESLDAKRSYIEGDERDEGMRMYLNLGHTIAHALEKQSDFTLSHGKALSIGLAVMSRYADDVCTYLRSHGLPTELNVDTQELCKLMLNDKKRRGDDVSLVLYKGLGSCELKTVKCSELHSILFGN